MHLQQSPNRQPSQAQAGYGRSPDGIGAIVTDAAGRVIPQAPTTHYAPQGAVFLEPGDTSGQAALQSAGFTALLVAVTTGIGLAWGKAWGAVAGLTIGAAATNGYRAQKWMNDPDPSRRHEAIVSATVAVGEVVVAGYSLYRGAQARK